MKNSLQETPGLDIKSADGERFFSSTVDPSVVPSLLYVSSHALATLPGASWADRTGPIQWLPIDLEQFDRRLTAAS